MKSVFPRAIIGGLALTAVIFVLAPLYGEGYDSIKLLLQGRVQEIVSSSALFSRFQDPWFIVVFGLAIILMIFGCEIEDQVNKAASRCEDKISQVLESVEDACLTKEEILELIKKVESTKEFPTNKSVLCNWCEYKSKCPEFTKQSLQECL